MKRLNAITAALLGTGLIASGSVAAWELPSWLGATVQSHPVAAAAPPPATISAATAPNYRAIVERYGPAVVGVTVEGTRKTAAGDNEDSNPFAPFFRGFPGFPNFQAPPQGWMPMPPEGGVPFRGQGSGFIVSSDGLVLTNAHVVQGADEVTVRLQDRREYRAKVLGSDPATDVAVLRIDAKEKLPVVHIGDPKALQVGDYVLAIGAPFGFEQTATQGIVSAKGRSLPGDAFVPFIQTDAAINPGNSGGPLFDASNGSVIGINAQIYSRTGGYQGVGFAIPIDVAMRVKDQIVATGHAQHARLGVTVQDLNQSLAQSFGLERPDGALVASVVPASPAARAGLKPGDVITQIDGQPVTRAGAVSSRIGFASPGDKVTLKVWRDKSAHEIEVRLGRVEDGAQQAAARGADAGQGELGLAVRPLSRDERAQARVDYGLVVQDVAGAAQRAGIVPGDLLLAVNGKPVSSVEQVRAALAHQPKSVALLIERNGNKIFVPVRLG